MEREQVWLIATERRPRVTNPRNRCGLPHHARFPDLPWTLSLAQLASSRFRLIHKGVTIALKFCPRV